MEVSRWLDLRPRARISHRARLVRFAPTVTIRLAQHQLHSTPARRKLGEQLDPFVVQYDMATPATLAGADMQGARIGIEIADLQCCQFAEAAAGEQRGSHEITEFAFGRVYQAPALIDA